MEKLADDIAELDRERRAETGSVHEHNLTSSERRFVEASDARGKRLYRSGWPDFMCVDRDTGGVVFVEVKSQDDDIRATQARMFTAIEQHLGMRVMVWDPKTPDRMVPWRAYQEGVDDRLDRGVSVRSHHRKRVPSTRGRDGR